MQAFLSIANPYERHPGITPYLTHSIKVLHGFLGHLRRMTTYLSLPGDSPAASKALPATKSAPEKLLRTCQREKSGAGKKEDAGGLTPTKDNDAAGRQIALYTPWVLSYNETAQL
uniref:hypothetical protein n=2 Tax=Candidatus Fimivicinus sp. TaxID=3056640 RepID=UPI003FF0E0D4